MAEESGLIAKPLYKSSYYKRLEIIIQRFESHNLFRWGVRLVWFPLKGNDKK